MAKISENTKTQETTVGSIPDFVKRKSILAKNLLSSRINALGSVFSDTDLRTLTRLDLELVQNGFSMDWSVRISPNDNGEFDVYIEVSTIEIPEDLRFLAKIAAQEKLRYLSQDSLEPK